MPVNGEHKWLAEPRTRRQAPEKKAGRGPAKEARGTEQARVFSFLAGWEWGVERENGTETEGIREKGTLHCVQREQCGLRGLSLVTWPGPFRTSNRTARFLV